VAAAPPFPVRVGSIEVPRDRISREAWDGAASQLPAYLFAHSVRSYCWGVALAGHDGLAFDAPVLWVASLLHDVGLTRIGRASRCFEYEGAEIARRFALRAGMPAHEADRVAAAIIAHMAPGVTLADGAESVLLDRATAVDVRHVRAELVRDIRGPIDRAYPRGAFDRNFRAAIAREVAIRTDCQSAQLLPRL
jgi:hypothetical protein